MRFPARMLRSGRAIFAVISAAILGCAIESGPTPPERETPSPRTSIDELPQPGSIITLEPEKSERTRCPHCSAENLIGETHCSRCAMRLSKEPVWVPCPLCAEKGAASLKDERCPQCGGRGWIISEEETQAVRKAEDAGTHPANPDGTPR
jgi:hypothetical protein